MGETRVEDCKYFNDIVDNNWVRVIYSHSYYCPARQILICKGCGITMNLAYPLKKALKKYGQE